MKLKGLLVTCTSVVLLGIAGAPGASAISDLRSSYAGVVSYAPDGTPLAQLYTAADYNLVNVYGRYANDSSGDRLQAIGSVRDRLPSNGQNVYAQGLRWNDGYYCYVSGIGSESVSVACTAGTWNPGGSEDLYTSESVPGWKSFIFRYPRSASMNSQRYELHACEDEPAFWPDICSGPRIIGIDWN